MVETYIYTGEEEMGLRNKMTIGNKESVGAGSANQAYASGTFGQAMTVAQKNLI